MDNETYVLGQYDDNENWLFLSGDQWVPEVKFANLMDKATAFDLCEKFCQEDLQVVIFRSKIFDGVEF